MRCFRIEFSVQQKVVFLKDDLKKPERDIIMFNRFPMVSITDCGTNHEVVETLLDHADQDLISNSVGMEHVWFLMDKDEGFNLSAQTLVCMRRTWARWEGDKCRLLVAKLKRELQRSNFSHDARIYRLKSKLTVMNGGVLSDAMEHSPPLEDLDLSIPELEDVDLSIPELEDAMCKDADMDKESEAVDATCKDAHHDEGSEAADAMCKDADMDMQHCEHACMIDLVSTSEDEVPPLPAAFFAPLPEPLPIGLPDPTKAIRRGTQPKNVSLMLESLAVQEPVCHKDHMTKVRMALKKRPAAADGAQEESPVLKRPAGAKAKSPACAKSSAAATPPAAKAKSPACAKIELLRKCCEVCEDPPRAGAQAGKISYKVQRDIFLAQIQCCQTKRHVCMLTEVQMGSRDLVKQGIELLESAWAFGATADDLQRIKRSGVLFGKCIGQGP